MDTNMAKFISDMEMKVDRTMKQYNLTEADVSMGNTAQIKGYIMGLRDAVNEAKKNMENNENVVVETTSDGYVTTQRRIRNRRRSESEE